MNFSKDDTSAMKGIAILLMIYHHCFLDPERWGNFEVSFFPFSEASVTYIASFFKICVGMFVFLSGYGLMISAKNKYKTYSLNAQQSSQLVLRRYKNLMEGWLPVFFLVIIVSFCIDKRPLTIYGENGNGIVNFLFDMFCISDIFGTPTLIATWWYMGLALILIFLFPILLWVYNKFGSIVLLVLSVLIPPVLNLDKTYLVLWILAFVLGMIFADYDILFNFKNWLLGKRKWLKIIASLMVFVVLILLRKSQIGNNHTEIFNPIASVYMIMISYGILPGWKTLYHGLQFLGKHSMNMFLTHNFIRVVYAYKWTYSFKNHFLIFIVLVVESLLLSIIIEWAKKALHYNEYFNKVSAKIKSSMNSNSNHTNLTKENKEGQSK